MTFDRVAKTNVKLPVSQPTSNTICGLDFSPEYISYASHRNSDPRIEFKAGDACALPFPDRSFDRVLSLLMLHFVPRDGRQLRLIDLDQRVEAIAGPIDAYGEPYRACKSLCLISAQWPASVQLGEVIR